MDDKVLKSCCRPIYIRFLYSLYLFIPWTPSQTRYCQLRPRWWTARRCWTVYTGPQLMSRGFGGALEAGMRALSLTGLRWATWNGWMNSHGPGELPGELNHQGINHLGDGEWTQELGSQLAWFYMKREVSSRQLHLLPRLVDGSQDLVSVRCFLLWSMLCRKGWQAPLHIRWHRQTWAWAEGTPISCSTSGSKGGWWS